MIEIAFLLLIAALGLVAGLVHFRIRAREEAARADRSDAEAVRQRDEATALRDQVAAERQKNAVLEERLAQQAGAFESRIAQMTDLQGQLRDVFSALSKDALTSNNAAFLHLAKENLEKLQQTGNSDLSERQKAIETLVQPIRESLQKVHEQIGAIEKDRAGAYGALNQQLRDLVETHLPSLRNETGNLVKALRQPQVRGRWGEVQLKRVVDLAGMQAHCDYTEQASVDTAEGRLRPDLIVHLPGGKSLVVDAKAPLRAYLDAVEANTEEQRTAHLKSHAQQIRAHIRALARKEYWDQFGDTPEFVVLFLPGEMFFSAALEQDPDLIEQGAADRIILATPTTLIALLRAVAYGWRQEALSVNAQAIADLGKSLYARMATLAEHWTKLGKSLQQSVAAYNQTVGTLESRVLPDMRRFADLSASHEGKDIETLRPVAEAIRPLTAPELNPVLPVSPAGEPETDPAMLSP